MKQRELIKKISLISILVSSAIVLSVVESFIPSFGIPGVKLGLANIIVIIALYEFGFIHAFLISLTRVFVTSLVVGNIFQMGFFMSLIGTFLSILAMFILKIVFKKLTIISVSVVGSCFHVVGQILVAFVYFQNAGILLYFPLIFLSSIITGIFIGFVANSILKLSIFVIKK